jgi:hypothetical protein
MKRRGQIAVYVILILVIASSMVMLLTLPKKNVTPLNNTAGTGYCASNSDCVPASCCHPNSCVVKEQAPQCKGMVCSEVCEPGTLDCMQGSCVCENNQCEAKLK